VAVVRKQILLDAAQNKRLRRLRAETGISESEIVRRALDAYDPRGGSDLQSEDVRELLEALIAQNAKTEHALRLAESEITATERYFKKQRRPRKKSRRRGSGTAASVGKS
jgi:hypothetical protein